MRKTNDILSQRMRGMERTLNRVAHILEEEALLRINIHKEQAALMGKMRSNDKTESVVAMLALVRHHHELGANAKSNGWRPNVNALEAHGFADPVMTAHEKLVAENAARVSEAETMAAEDAEAFKRYEYCVCEALPDHAEWNGYDSIRGASTFREMNSESEALEIAFAGNGVYAFRYDREAIHDARTWELISPVRKEGEDEKLEN